MESTQSAVGFGAPERGVCRVCGRDLKLVWTSGMVTRHRNIDGTRCPGGGRPPTKPSDEQTVELPDA